MSEEYNNQNPNNNINPDPTKVGSDNKTANSGQAQMGGNQPGDAGNNPNNEAGNSNYRYSSSNFDAGSGMNSGNYNSNNQNGENASYGNNSNNYNSNNGNGYASSQNSGSYNSNNYGGGNYNQNANGNTNGNNGYNNMNGNANNSDNSPYHDNVYRFQKDGNDNRNNGQNNQNYGGRKEGKGVGKIIAAAAVFGLIAAVCFYAVTFIANKIAPPDQGDLIGQVEPVTSSSGDNGSQTIHTVSGASVSTVGDISGIVDSVMPAMVSITETKLVQSYFGQIPSTGAGTGFIIKQDSDELIIVTNNHVVEGSDNITATFVDDSKVKATIKGTDKTADIAVLTVKLKDLKSETKSKIKVANLASSEDVKVGQMVIAIGNALGYGQSVTVGYLSAKDREMTDSETKEKSIRLQTDAAINPGNSGGALIDMNGNVIGINEAKSTGTTVEGMGYAIPMSDAIPIINDLMKRQVLADSEKGYLGVTVRTITSDIGKQYNMPEGVYIMDKTTEGGAENSELQKGDIIVKIDDTKIRNNDQLKNKVNSLKAGTVVRVTLKRNEGGEYKEKEVKVKLGKSTEKPSDKSDNSNGYGNGYGSGNGYGNGNGNGDDYDYGYGDDDDDFFGGSQIVPW